MQRGLSWPSFWVDCVNPAARFEDFCGGVLSLAVRRDALDFKGILNCIDADSACANLVHGHSTSAVAGSGTMDAAGSLLRTSGDRRWMMKFSG